MADLVIDASLATAWCFPDERTDYTNGVLQAISSTLVAFVPRLWAYEVRNSVLTGFRRGRIAQADAEEFLDSLNQLNINQVDPVSYRGIYTLAEKTGLSFYDASYLDLAIREGAQIATLDEPLRRACADAGVTTYRVK
jgi:predicted nucleic acid-binding protein